MSEILNTNGRPVQGDGSAEILKPNGQPVHPPEPELDNLSKAIISLYGALTEDHKIILSVGSPIVGILTQTPGTSGLNLKIFPAEKCRVDHANKKVIFLEDAPNEKQIAEASPVSPEQGNAVDAGTEEQTPKGIDFGGGADAAQ